MDRMDDELETQPTDEPSGETPPSAPPADQPDGGDKPEDKKPPFVIDGKPIERWNDLYSRYSRYAKFGKPEEVEARLTRLEEYERALEAHRRAQQPRSQAEELRAQLLQLLPELSTLQKMSQSHETLQQRIAALNIERAQARLTTLLQEHGIEASPEEREDLEELLTQKMSDEQRQALLDGQLEVVDEVFKAQLSRKGLLGYLKAKSAAQKPPPRPPV